MKFKFNLGDEVEDLMTGFKGNIEVRSQCLNGCIQYTIQPKTDKDKKIPDSWAIDEQQLKLIGKSPLKKVQPKKAKSMKGGLRKKISRT